MSILSIAESINQDYEEEINKQAKAIQIYQKENRELNNKINKVREYIKKHPCETWYYVKGNKLVVCQNELLDILGDDEE